MERIEIENRLISFAVKIIKLTRNLNSEFVSEHITKQIIRSSTSSALNYGETQGAESYNDFIHKMSTVLKELRETFISLKIINQLDLLKSKCEINELIHEGNELISLFHKSVSTAKSRKKT